MLTASIHTSPAARVGICFLFVSILASSSSALEIHNFYPEERDELIQLRDNVYSSFFNLHRNWTGPPCNKSNSSRWAGVGCFDWHVTHLVLEGINLTGSLHPTTLLQNLTFLTKLSFRNNNLNGPLPNLTNLVHLEHVFLSRNRFSGFIPTGYIRLPDLIGLELQENDLSGLIPPFDQQSVMAFNVSHNHLQGKVPETPVLQRFTKSSFDNNSGLCGGGEIIGLNPCPNPIPLAPAPVTEAPWPSIGRQKWQSRPQAMEHCGDCGGGSTYSFMHGSVFPLLLQQDCSRKWNKTRATAGSRCSSINFSCTDLF